MAIQSFYFTRLLCGLLPIWLLWPCGYLFAQQPFELAGKYQEHEKVILEKHEIVNLQVDGDALEINIRHKQRTYFPGINYNGNLKDRVSYEPEFTAVTDLQGYTYTPDYSKNKYKRKKISRPEDIKLLSTSVFHDGLRAKSFYFEEVKQGAITELDYTVEKFEPYMLGRVIFADNYLMLQKSFTLTFHPSITLALYYYNCEASAFQIDTSYTEEGLTSITWTRTNMAEPEPYFKRPSPLNYLPHISYQIQSYLTEKGEEKRVLKDLTDTYNWNNAHLMRANNTFTDELKELTRNLCAEAPTKRDKAIGIYNWVCNSISYIAFEDGMGGFQPRDAAAVCTKRYGDCKDMANLMVEMMRYAGLNASPVWIGTRSLPYQYSTMPAPYVANHMICALNLDDSIYFLDATNKGLPFGYPSMFTQGKEALIARGESQYELATVPVVKAALNRHIDSNWLHFESGNLKGLGKNVLTGHWAFLINSGLEGQNKEILNKAASAIYQKQAPRCKSNLLQFSRSGPSTTVEYSLTAPDFGEKIQDYLYLNLNLDQPLKSFAVDTARNVALDLEKCSQIEKHLVLQIPEGYTIDFIPENSSGNYPDFNYSVSYQANATHIIYQLNLNLHKILIEPDDFTAWNEFIHRLNQAYQQSVVLKKI